MSTYCYFPGVGLVGEYGDQNWYAPIEGGGPDVDIELVRQYVRSLGYTLREFPRGLAPCHEYEPRGGEDWYLGHLFYPVTPEEGQRDCISGCSLSIGGYAVGSPVVFCHDQAGRRGGPYYEIVGYISGPPEKFWFHTPSPYEQPVAHARAV